MKPKTKPPARRPQNELRSEANEFLWHLRPPWREMFSHEHWWIANCASASPRAAVWELVRRHPTTGVLMERRGGAGSSVLKGVPYLRVVIAKHGGECWPALTAEQQAACLEAISLILPQRGVGPVAGTSVTVIGGPDDPQARTFNEIRMLAKRFFESLYEGQAEDEVAMDQAEQLWCLVQQRAFPPICAGHVLVSFDPHMPGVERLVVEQVEAIIEKNRCPAGARDRAGRAFWQTWLKVVADFEQGELSRRANQKRNDQLFARYRRVIQHWKWPC